MARLPVETCIIDREAVVVDQNGLSIFNLLRYRQHDHAATLCAFDLIELDGADLRRCPIEERKQHLASCGNSTMASRSMRHTIAMAPSSMSMPARSVARASSQASWLALPCWLYGPVAQDEKPTHQPSVVSAKSTGRSVDVPTGSLLLTERCGGVTLEGRFHSLAAPWNCSLAPRRDWARPRARRSPPALCGPSRLPFAPRPHRRPRARQVTGPTFGSLIAAR
jgi:hypothetical protein